MNFFKRLFKIGEAEANSAIDKMEDPIKLTEQGIRDLRQDLEKNLEALAQVKALAIRAKNDKEDFTNQAEEYQNNAMLILKKAKNGELEQAEADRLAKEALVLRETANKKSEHAQSEHQSLQQSVNQLEANIQQIKSNIANWENELRTLKARVKVSKAKSSLNKQMAELDNTGTVAMLERMKDKVAQEEALAEAYGEIANAHKPIDKEIADAANRSESDADEALRQLKEQINQSENS